MGSNSSLQLKCLICIVPANKCKKETLVPRLSQGKNKALRDPRDENRPTFVIFPHVEMSSKKIDAAWSQRTVAGPRVSVTHRTVLSLI